MPCLNEEETITACILKAKRSIESNNLDAEILISDNGSIDGTRCIAEKLGARIVYTKERGYGNALKHGIEHAKGKYVIMGDADDSYDFSNISSFISKLRDGYDLVMGNRFKGGIQKNAMPFLHRYFGNPVLSFIGSLFFKIPIGDFHCGLRAFNRQSIVNIQLCCTGMEFASEMVVKASLHNLKITEVPTTLYPDGRSRAPHLRPWRDGWRHLRFLLLYSPRWLFLLPGLTIMLLGIIITSVLFFGPVKIKSISFDIHTMLYSSVMVIIGFQAVTFYFFSRIFAIKTGLVSNNKLLKSFTRHFTLEKGLITGVLLLLAGIILTIASLKIWDKYSFGNLDPVRMLRLVIPAVTFLVLGVQVILNSFFAGILYLENERGDSNNPNSRNQQRLI